MAERPLTAILNDKGEPDTRPMNDEEYEQWQIDRADYAAKAALPVVPSRDDTIAAAIAAGVGAALNLDSAQQKVVSEAASAALFVPQPEPAVQSEASDA